MSLFSTLIPVRYGDLKLNLVRCSLCDVRFTRGIATFFSVVGERLKVLMAVLFCFACVTGLEMR